MAEKARDKGYKVGIVSSVSLDHATPACFYAHQPSRNNYYEISMEAAKSGFDYFGGGGFKDPAGKKSKIEGEKQNALDALKAAGYVVADTAEAIKAAKPGTKLVALNPDILLVMTKGLESAGGVDGLIAAQPSIALTTAGKNRRIIDVEDTLIFAGGTRIPDVLDGLARAIYSPDSLPAAA